MANFSLKSLFTGRFSSRWQPTRDSDGFIPVSSIYGFSPQFNDYTGQKKKLELILSNPALMKVFALQCDMFSLGRIKVYKKNVEVEDDFTRLMNNPSPFQSGAQLLWDYMFWTMMDTSYCWITSKSTQDAKIYFLDPSKITWPESIKKAKDKFILSKKSTKDIRDTVIKYRHEDGTDIYIPISELIITTDLSNGTGNWFKGSSRIDALYKVISNSEAALDADNINIRYSGKFLVSGTQDPKDPSKLPLSEPERQDIESRVNGSKQVHAYKSKIEIERFVSDLRALELGKKYLELYFIIGSMYGIQRDVLEAYNSSTYENQEKARGSHVSYTLEPKGNDFMLALTNFFGYAEQGKQIKIKWDHLQFMNVFKKDEAITKNQTAQTFVSLLKAGVPVDEINNFLGTTFKTAKIQNNAA